MLIVNNISENIVNTNSNTDVARAGYICNVFAIATFSSYILCPWTNCVEQTVIRFAVYRHIARHVQEETENTFLFDAETH